MTDRERIEEMRKTWLTSPRVLQSPSFDFAFLLAQIDKRDEALRNLLDTLVRTSVYSPGIRMGKTQLAQAWNKAREALGEE